MCNGKYFMEFFYKRKKIASQCFKVHPYRREVSSLSEVYRDMRKSCDVDL